MDPIHEQRARAKRLAELAGIEHPWQDADKQLKAAQAEEKRREAEEAAAKERQEAQRLADAVGDYRRVIGEIKQKRTEIAEKQAEIAALPADAAQVFARLSHWLQTPNGHIWRQEYKLQPAAVGAGVNTDNLGRGALPAGFTWDQVDAAERYRQLSEQLGNLQEAAHNYRVSLEIHEQTFPALRDLRESEGIH